MNQKTKNTSLFLVGITASSVAMAIPCSPGSYGPAGATACLEADAGYYVPTAGATAETPAPAGYYVPTSGATAATISPPGYYVPTSGATAATISPPGYYVPTSGATTPIAAPAGTYIAVSGSTSCQMCIAAPVGTYVPTSGSTNVHTLSEGFYAPSTGSINQVPAGGIAAPLTAGIQSSSMLVDMAGDLYERYDPSSVKVSVSYQRSNVDQTGLPSGQFNNNLYAAMVQADLIKFNGTTSGINFGYAYNSLKNGSAVGDTGNTYQVALFNSGSVFDGNYHGSLLYGYASNSLQRNVTYSRYSSGSAVTNNETLNSSPNVSWYGLTSRLSYPLYSSWSGTAQLNLLYYNAASFNESGTASANGQSVASLTALNVSSVNYLSAPAMLGINYDIIDKEGRQFAPVVLTVGAIGNLNPTKNIQASTFDYASSLSLPVNQTSLVYGLVKLKFNGWEIAKGTRVNGVLQTLQASGASTYQAGLNLVKDW